MRVLVYSYLLLCGLTVTGLTAFAQTEKADKVFVVQPKEQPFALLPDFDTLVNGRQTKYRMLIPRYWAVDSATFSNGAVTRLNDTLWLTPGKTKLPDANPQTKEIRKKGQPAAYPYWENNKGHRDSAAVVELSTVPIPDGPAQNFTCTLKIYCHNTSGKSDVLFQKTYTVIKPVIHNAR